MEVLDKRYKGWTKPIVLKASNGKEVDLRCVASVVKNNIKGIPKKEQESILAKYSEFRSFISRNVAYKKDKYGQTNAQRAWNKREEIVEMFGRMFRIEDIRQILVEDYDIYVSSTWLNKFKSKHRELISEKIDIYRNSIDSLRLTYKRSRLEELTDIYYIEKSEYRRVPQTQRALNMTRILNQIRQEVEGNNLTINLKHEIDLRATVNEHLAKEALKKVSIQQVILARVAAKNGLNPLTLQTSLANGYYSKLQKAIDTGSLDEIDSFAYPSERNYDIMEMEELIREKELKAQEERQRFEEAEVLESRINDPEEVRKRMLERLRQESSQIESRKNMVTLQENMSTLGQAFRSRSSQKDEGITVRRKKVMQTRLKKDSAGFEGGEKQVKKNIKKLVKKRRN